VHRRRRARRAHQGPRGGHLLRSAPVAAAVRYTIQPRQRCVASLPHPPHVVTGTSTARAAPAATAPPASPSPCCAPAAPAQPSPSRSPRCTRAPTARCRPPSRGSSGARNPPMLRVRALAMAPATLPRPRRHRPRKAARPAPRSQTSRRRLLCDLIVVGGRVCLCGLRNVVNSVLRYGSCDGNVFGLARFWHRFYCVASCVSFAGAWLGRNASAFVETV
jgi:hypothetical protein